LCIKPKHVKSPFVQPWKKYGVGENLFAIGTCCSSGIINLLEMGLVVDLNWQVWIFMESKKRMKGVHGGDGAQTKIVVGSQVFWMPKRWTQHL
jgi:hypothetical protein